MDRLRTTAWILGVLALVILLIAPPDRAEETTRPTTLDRGVSGLAAFVQWLRSADVPVRSVRERFDDFRFDQLPAHDNLAVIHLPATLLFEADEISALMHWVATGNRLLIAAAYLEGADWVYEGNDINRSMMRLVGTRFVAQGDGCDADTDGGDDSKQDAAAQSDDAIDNPADAFLSRPGWLVLQGARRAAPIEVTLDESSRNSVWRSLPLIEAPWDCARWKRVSRAHRRAADERQSDAELPGDDELPADGDGDADTPTTEETPRVRRIPAWELDARACPNGVGKDGERWLSGSEGCVAIPTPRTDAWRARLGHVDGEQHVLYDAPLGQGEVLLLLHPSLLANDVIHRGDNRRFAMTLVNHYLGAEGVVLVDDAHLGLNSIVEFDDLLLDWRLYATLGFVLLFWLGYVLADVGSWIRAKYRPRAAALGQKDLIAANANYLGNRLRATAVNDLILEPLRERLARKWGVPREDALSQGLARERAAHADAVGALEDTLGRLRNGKSVPHLTLARQVFDVETAIS